MRLFPIIPLWIMTPISIILLIFILKSKKKNLIQIIIIILLFVINLRIMIPTKNSEIQQNNLDVLFVIDNTISMEANDYSNNKTRLQGVKEDCKNIIEQLQGARFSIITFNNNAKVVTPFTKDTNTTIETIDIISPISELAAKGSSLNTPLETILLSLKSSSNEKNRIKILFFISDGEITDESTLESYKEVKKYISNGAVLGYGTTSGGTMKIEDKYYNTSKYIMDNYKLAVSKLDETNLKKIAKDTNIDYINMNKQSNLKAKLKQIKNITTSKLAKSDKSSYDDTYYFLLLPLLVLLTIEFNKYRSKLLWKNFLK